MAITTGKGTGKYKAGPETAFSPGTATVSQNSQNQDWLLAFAKRRVNNPALRVCPKHLPRMF